MLDLKLREHQFAAGIKRSIRSDSDEKPEPPPAKRQRVSTPEEESNLLDFVQKLCEHADNWKLRADFAQDILHCFYSIYSDNCSSAERDEVQKGLAPEIVDFFKIRNACMERLQETMNQVCRVLGEEQCRDKSASELLHLLKQGAPSVEVNSMVRDSLDVNEESGDKEQKSSDQVVSRDVLSDSPESSYQDLCQSLSNAIEQEKISTLSIEEWCFQKEAFIWYVRTFPSQLMIDSQTSLINAFDSTSDNHYIAQVLARSKSHALRSAVIQWENYVEFLSSNYLNFEELCHDSSIAENQIAQLQKYHDALNFGLLGISNNDQVNLDQLTYLLSRYMRYAQWCTSWLCDYLLDRPWEFTSFAREAVLIAAEAGHVSLTLLLLRVISKNASVDFIDKLHTDILSTITYSGHYALLHRVLCDYEPDVRQAKYLGIKLDDVSLLDLAAAEGTSGTVQCILNYLDSRNEIEDLLQDKDQGLCDLAQACMWVVTHGREERGFHLFVPYLRKKPDYKSLLTLGDDAEDTPLLSAVQRGSLNMMRIMVEEFGADLNLSNEAYETPLDHAILGGSLEKVNYLVNAGANIKQTQANFFTPLMFAVKENNLGMVKCLVYAGAELESFIHPDPGETALMYAACGGYHEIAKVLVDAWANVSTKNVRGETPSAIAEQKEHTDLATYLKETEIRRIPTNVDAERKHIFSLFTQIPEEPVKLIDSYLYWKR